MYLTKTLEVVIEGGRFYFKSHKKGEDAFLEEGLAEQLYYEWLDLYQTIFKDKQVQVEFDVELYEHRRYLLLSQFFKPETRDSQWYFCPIEHQLSLVAAMDEIANGIKIDGDDFISFGT